MWYNLHPHDMSVIRMAFLVYTVICRFEFLATLIDCYSCQSLNKFISCECLVIVNKILASPIWWQIITQVTYQSVVILCGSEITSCAHQSKWEDALFYALTQIKHAYKDSQFAIGHIDETAVSHSHCRCSILYYILFTCLSGTLLLCGLVVEFIWISISRQHI